MAKKEPDYYDCGHHKKPFKARIYLCEECHKRFTLLRTFKTKNIYGVYGSLWLITRAENKNDAQKKFQEYINIGMVGRYPHPLIKLKDIEEVDLNKVIEFQHIE